MKKIKTIFIVGPTASGKTGLGAQLASILGGEVISADSMQIYKGMTIASAAPVSSEDTLGIPHHLVEFLEYGQAFTVADYSEIAREKIKDIASRRKLPVVVGGTGLYINALTQNIEFTEIKTSPDVRIRLQREVEQYGTEKLLSRLNSIDPDAAAALHPNDTRRIIRALEIYESTGMTKTEQNRLSKLNPSPFEPIIIGLYYRDRTLLYNRIEKRIDIMLKNGLVEEARAAFNQAFGRTDGAVQAIGHKELFPYFRGEISLEEAVEELKKATRHYAKRQMTWFSKNQEIHPIYRDETEDIVSRALNIIEEESK